MEDLQRLCNLFNCGPTYAKEQAEAILMEHPTIQQNAMRFALELIKLEAENKMVDLRNEATVELCKDILKNLSYEQKQGLPFI